MFLVSVIFLFHGCYTKVPCIMYLFEIDFLKNCPVTFHWKDIPQFVYPLPIEVHLDNFQFGSITNKLLWIFMYNFLPEISFYYFGINAWECNCWSFGKSIFNFKRNHHTFFFRIAVSFYISTSLCEWSSFSASSPTFDVIILFISVILKGISCWERGGTPPPSLFHS